MRISWLSGLLFLTVLVACAPPVPRSGSLPFTTIELKNDAGYIGQQQYNALDPGVMVFFDRESVLEGGVWFSEEARRTLDRVDWRTQFVLAGFLGWRPSGGFEIEIEQVLLDGDVVQIIASVRVPEDAATPAVTSPYHLIAVRRPATPAENLVVELVIDGEVVARHPTPAPEG